jgi:hypothetical protein
MQEEGLGAQRTHALHGFRCPQSRSFGLALGGILRECEVCCACWSSLLLSADTKYMKQTCTRLVVHLSAEGPV